jgi:hypothetical protein
MSPRAAERAHARQRIFLLPRSARLRAGTHCPPQASACPLRPDPIVFRAAAAAILKLFSGLSEEGGAWAGELTRHGGWAGAPANQKRKSRPPRPWGRARKESGWPPERYLKGTLKCAAKGSPWAGLSPGQRAVTDRSPCKSDTSF